MQRNKIKQNICKIIKNVKTNNVKQQYNINLKFYQMIYAK